MQIPQFSFSQTRLHAESSPTAHITVLILLAGGTSLVGVGGGQESSRAGIGTWQDSLSAANPIVALMNTSETLVTAGVARLW